MKPDTTKSSGDKISGAEIDISSNKTAKKFENFFYYYKWHVLVISFFAIVLIVGIVQLVAKKEPDAIITYAGKNYVSAKDLSQIEEILSAEAAKNLKKNKLDINCLQYQICSAEEIEELRKNDQYVNGGQIMENQNQFYNMISSGTTGVFLVSSHVYKNLLDHGRLAELNTVYNSFPNIENDGFSFKLGDLSAYKNNEILQILPPDTRVCLAKKSVYTSDKDYSSMKEIFKGIVN